MPGKFIYWLVLGFLALLPGIVCAGAMPRTVIVLYNPNQYADWDDRKIAATRVHELAEMPLNHLGLVLEYHNVAEPLPEINNRADVLGVLTWFESGARMQDPLTYLQWASAVVQSGKKYVILGDPGFIENTEGMPTPLEAMNSFFKTLGLRMEGSWIDVTYDVNVLTQDKAMTGFERRYEGVMAPYHTIHKIDNNVMSHVVVQKADNTTTESHVVVTGPHGGYAAGGYEFFDFYGGDMYSVRQWYINPFRFFAEAFGTDGIPKPDTTTLAGRRIYYSQIDGDGWNNVTHIEAYEGKDVLSTEVIMERVIKAFPDLPVTVAPIAADLDPAWEGNDNSRRIAKEIFALPQVEIGSHTYSHPFSWKFFADGNTEKEIPYLDKYPGKIWHQPANQSLVSLILPAKRKAISYSDHSDADYTVPRAFADKPFDIHMEVEGAAETINALAPEGKKAAVLQWSGDTLPFEQAVELTAKAGLRNINGGDDRFDDEYPSYGWVSPLGRKVGDYWQVYASNSNENTYTNLWSSRFHGFKYMLKTAKNTDFPIRLKPFDIYYHMYSGEREASLNAVLNNLRYAQAQEFVPIHTSQFSDVATGFFHANLTPLGNNMWRITDRGALETIRFDDADNISVDFGHSAGVIGQRHYQGSLYVYLDASIPIADIAVQHETGNAPVPYLVQSRWLVHGMRRESNNFYFTCEGFGKGEMEWFVPVNGAYTVTVEGGKSYQAIAKGNRLQFTLEEDGLTPRRIHIVWRERA